MNEMEKITSLLRENYLNGATKNVNLRRQYLIELKKSIINHFEQLKNAFKKDYNKCEFDVVANELLLVMNELNYYIKNIKKFVKPKRKKVSLLNFKSKGYTMPEPYGVVLIVTPWNYPFQLSILPLIAAVASGNVVVLKLSKNTVEVSKIIKKILAVFPENYVYVTTAEGVLREQIFDVKYDYVFCTSSVNVGKLVYNKQSKYLTPMTLELGGKSPAVIDKTADLDLSAKRIVWGKFLNGGQTCVAPDYVIIHKSIKDSWLKFAKKYIQQFYYENGKIKDDFTHIINNEQIERLNGYLKNANIFTGGKIKGKLIEPAILTDINFNSDIMQEEIFGPILPILEFENFDELVKIFKAKEKPLAFYYFGNDNVQIDKVFKDISFGGGCINDTIMHLTEHNLPFGGVGNSGMGSYHGKKSFDTFSHYKSLLIKSKKELQLKYPPYNENKLKFIKWLLKLK